MTPTSPLRVGYVRTTHPSQNTAGQIAALEADGCTHIITDFAPNVRDESRPQLVRLLPTLPAGSILVVAQWNRATRSTFDALDLITVLRERGMGLRVLDRPYLTFTDDASYEVLSLLMAFWHDERERFKSYTREARELGEAEGRSVAGLRIFSAGEKEDILSSLRNGELPRKIGERYGCHRTTITKLAQRLGYLPEETPSREKPRWVKEAEGQEVVPPRRYTAAEKRGILAARQNGETVRAIAKKYRSHAATIVRICQSMGYVAKRRRS